MRGTEQRPRCPGQHQKKLLCRYVHGSLFSNVGASSNLERFTFGNEYRNKRGQHGHCN